MAEKPESGPTKTGYFKDGQFKNKSPYFSLFLIVNCGHYLQLYNPI